jgi:hypothetical protein
MKRMESPSIVGVVVAMARVVHAVTAVTMTGTMVAATTVHQALIPSRYRCLHRQDITKKRTRGAIKSREASLLASWVEPKLHYLIVTSSSCRKRSRRHNKHKQA